MGYLLDENGHTIDDELGAPLADNQGEDSTSAVAVPGAYRTSQGDMWDRLARELLGSEKHMNLLIEANPKHQATVIFSAGVYLSVPQIDTSTTSETLPPWKQ